VTKRERAAAAPAAGTAGSTRPGWLDKTRYTYKAILDEVRLVVESMPRGTHRALGDACNLDHPGFSKRLAGGRGYSFSIEHLGAIADALNAPPGWPFIPWNGAATAAPPTPSLRVMRGRLAAAQLRRFARLIDGLAEDMAESS
jgi:hypothetical protein